MIFIEALVVETLSAAGIKTSMSASVEWTEDYVLFSKTGGVREAYGNSLTGKTGRGRVSVDFNVYSMDRVRAAELAERVAALLEDMESQYYFLSNLVVSEPVSTLAPDKQYGYTLGLTVTINKNTNP